MLIRRATEEDLRRIFEIELESYPEEELATLEKYQWRLKYYGGYFYVGEVDGEIATVALCALNKDVRITDDIYEMELMEEGNNGALITLMTAKKFRRHGYGEEMIEFFLEKLQKDGVRSASLSCKDYLIHYFAKFGFKKYGVSQSELGGAIYYDMVKTFDN